MAAFIEIPENVSVNKNSLSLPPSYEKSVYKNDNNDCNGGDGGACSISPNIKRRINFSALANDNVMQMPKSPSVNMSSISIVEKIQPSVALISEINDESSTSMKLSSNKPQNGDDILDNYYKAYNLDSDDSDNFPNDDVSVFLYPEHQSQKNNGKLNKNNMQFSD